MAAPAGPEVCCTSDPHLAQGLRHLLILSCSSDHNMVRAAPVKLMSVYLAIMTDALQADLAAVALTPLPASLLCFGS